MESAGVNRRRGLLVLCAVFIASVFAGGPTSSAFAHGGAADAALRHMEEDFVIHSPAKERRLERRTRAATVKDAEAAVAAVAGDAGNVGQWGPVIDWPVVGVHAALLANGKVLAYDSVGDNASETYPVHDHTRATVWDPATGTQTPVNVTGYNIFCSGR